MAGIWAASAFVYVALIAAYIWLNDLKLKRLPPEASSLSPHRWTRETVKEEYEKSGLKDEHSLLEGKLPPQTGRRYIVVGGVS